MKLGNELDQLAFPHAEITALEQEKEAIYYGGMSLRDYFAAKIVSEFIGENPSVVDADFASYCAERSYLVADAMLRARQRPSALAGNGL